MHHRRVALNFKSQVALGCLGAVGCAGGPSAVVEELESDDEPTFVGSSELRVGGLWDMNPGLYPLEILRRT